MRNKEQGSYSIWHSIYVIKSYLPCSIALLLSYLGTWPISEYHRYPIFVTTMRSKDQRSNSVWNLIYIIKSYLPCSSLFHYYRPIWGHGRSLNITTVTPFVFLCYYTVVLPVCVWIYRWAMRRGDSRGWVQLQPMRERRLSTGCCRQLSMQVGTLQNRSRPRPISD